MGIVERVLDFRLNIDQEYQGWILAFATLTAFWIYCLPCYCAGMQFTLARRYAAWIQQRLPYFLAMATIINGGMLFLVCTWLPDWAPKDYIKGMLSFVVFAMKNAVKFMTSIAFIAIFVFVVAFKDRLMKLAGIDHKTIFRFKLRDVFGGSSRAIQLDILKVEDLPAASPFSANNVFIEVFMGYNEPMKTRVHNNAGSNCVMKETLQLNFDDSEEDEPLFLFVKNQKVVGTGNLCRLELKVEDVIDIEKKLKGRDGWNDTSGFVTKNLIPRGTITFRVIPVDDDEARMQMC